jgi:phosphoserine phosphatase
MPIISFDFDGTICDSELFPIAKNIAIAKSHKADGYKVIIVTARSPSKSNEEFISNFLDQSNISDIFSDIIFTGGIKAKHLKHLGVARHYDNDISEVDAAKLIGVNVIYSPE